MPPLLILTPLKIEHDALRAALFAPGGIPDDGSVIVAVGGHGKVEFALAAQHLLRLHSPRALIAVGAAGSLSPRVKPLDIVVALETVEHDFNLRFIQRPLPRFNGDPALIDRLRRPSSDFDFELHFATVASGDEDVIEAARAQQIAALTGAVAVAWEGAGGARAARLNKTPYLEIRAITDLAQGEVMKDFKSNIQKGMQNAARVLRGL